MDPVTDYLTRIRAAKTATLPPCPLVTDEFIAAPPYAVGVSHLMLRPRFLLADPTGTGKTPMSLVAYAQLKSKQPSLKLLVHTTQSAQFQWARNVWRFLRGVEPVVLSYEPKDAERWKDLGPRGRAAQWAKMANGDGDIWITTYALSAQEEQQILTHLRNFYVIFDEAHVLRSHKGEVLYPSMARLSQKARGAWALTATPMMDGRIDELYAVMEAIRPGTFGDPSEPPEKRYAQFRKTYHELVLIKPKWKIKGTQKAARPFYKTTGYKNLPLLRSLMDPFYLKRPAEEMNQFLPPIRYQQLDLVMEAKQQALYRDIIQLHWPGSKTPIQQLASLTFAQMAVDAPAVLGYPSVPSAKLTELLRLLKDQFADQKVLVFSKFEKVVQYLSVQLTKAGISHGQITGAVSATTREAVRMKFQTDPTSRVVLLTTAGAQALDLQAAGVVICYDLPWTPGELEQIVGRARRVGSQHPSILVVLLTIDHSIDSKVIRTLTHKETRTRSTLPGYSSADVTLKDRTTVSSELANFQLPGHADPVTVPIPDDLSDLFAAVGADR